MLDAADGEADVVDVVDAPPRLVHLVIPHRWPVVAEPAQLVHPAIPHRRPAVAGSRSRVVPPVAGAAGVAVVVLRHLRKSRRWPR
jgi:hypothetical protein